MLSITIAINIDEEKNQEKCGNTNANTNARR